MSGVMGSNPQLEIGKNKDTVNSIMYYAIIRKTLYPIIFIQYSAYLENYFEL